MLPFVDRQMNAKWMTLSGYFMTKCVFGQHFLNQSVWMSEIVQPRRFCGVLFCAFHDLHVPIPIQLPQRNSASAAHVCAADALFICGSWASCIVSYSDRGGHFTFCQLNCNFWVISYLYSVRYTSYIERVTLKQIVTHNPSVRANYTVRTEQMDGVTCDWKSLCLWPSIRRCQSEWQCRIVRCHRIIMAHFVFVPCRLNWFHNPYDARN